MKELLLKLYNAKDADELDEIINTDPRLSDVIWKPYGGNENNCGIFEGQQNTAEAALIEKITNSIDAILMKECMISGCNPKDDSNPDLPRSMSQAIEKYYEIKYGQWENATEQKRREISQQLQLLVDGDKTTPNITIYDNGEGQNPDNFVNTFLSLAQGNKADVPFVQGKFNMGSTGAVLFCGGNKYQLIISRRHNLLPDSDGRIGFTLVRRHPLTEEEEHIKKRTWYEFLTINEEVPSFECNEIDLGLNETNFIDGSVVKLFSYALSRGCRSDATLDLWRELNTLLYDASLPVLIYEKRDYKGHSKTKLMLGNKTRVSLDDRDKKYASLSYSINNQKIFGAEIPIEVTIFKQSVKNNEFIRYKPVVFLLNGQTQGFENRTFISSDLGLRQLRDNILISVDCTKIKATPRNDLFMSSRDRMRQSEIYSILKDAIVDQLKHDEHLKRINQEFKNTILHESKEDKKLIETLFSSLKNNKDINNLFKGLKGEFSFKDKKTKKTENEESKNHSDENKKNLKRYPSFFKVEGLKDEEGKKYKAVPKGGKGIIKFSTDVENEYLTRNIDRGDLEINILEYGEGTGGQGGIRYPATLGDKVSVQRSGPIDGEIKLTIQANDSIEVGEVFPLSVKLISPSGEMEVVVFIKIETENKQNNKQKRKENDEPELNLPKAVRIFKDKNPDEEGLTWEEYNSQNPNDIITANDTIKLCIGDEDNIEAIYINMDSNLLKKEINKKKADVSIINKLYFSSLYAHALMMYSSLLAYYKKLAQDKEGHEYDPKEVIDELNTAIESAFEYYSGFLLNFNTDELLENDFD